MSALTKSDASDFLDSHIAALLKIGRRDPRFLQRQVDLHREQLEFAVQRDPESPGAKALAAAVKMLEAEVKRDALAFEGT